MWEWLHSQAVSEIWSVTFGHFSLLSSLSTLKPNNIWTYSSSATYWFKSGVCMLFSCKYTEKLCVPCHLVCTHLPLVYRKSQAELREQIDQLSEGNLVNVLIQGSHDYKFEWGTTTLHSLARVWRGSISPYTDDVHRLNYVVASQVHVIVLALIARMAGIFAYFISFLNFKYFNQTTTPCAVHKY